jgi:DNA-binding GntR family transcriptional regulator
MGYEIPKLYLTTGRFMLYKTSMAEITPSISRPASKGKNGTSPGKTRRRVTKDYLSQNVYWDLRRRIAEGEFPPGSHLKEEELVRTLGVSRTVVRHGLIQLTSEGLLIDVPKRGKTVTEFSEETLARLLPIRICLEQLAAREAIARLSDEDAKELKKLGEALKNPKSDPTEQIALDLALHRKIWQVARNDELEKILNRTVGPFHLMAVAVLVSPAYRRNWIALSWQQVILERERDAGGHQPLVQAICARDVPAAMRAMEDHLTLNYASSPDEFNRRVAKLMLNYWHQGSNGR